MKRALYCVDRASPNKLKAGPSCEVSSRVKDIAKKEYSVVIIDARFLSRRKKLKLSAFKNKTFLVYFPKGFRNPYKELQDRFFDYLTCDDSKQAVSFKIKRARRTSQLIRRINNLEDNLSRKNKKIERISIIDPLTNCYNWRYFLYRAAQELSRAQRHLHTLSFIAIDTDNFRHINEIYGVKVADTVIRDMIDILSENLREEDVLTRWRGDEFYIILPHLDNRNAYRVAKRIHERVSRHQFKYRDINLNIKTSLGIITSPQDNIKNTRDVVGALGKCLSYAKRRGGNSIVLFSKPKFKRNKLSEDDTMSINELRDKIDKMSVLLTRDLLEMIYGFARAIEAKDSYTGKHVEYTSTLAEEIAKELALPENEVENIKNASVLHDLGKVGIDESILSKSGPLTPEEKVKIKTHPSIAAEILRGIHALRGSVPSVLYHHERYDGKGYPLGLKGEEIPLGARIVAVADVYQALISDRPYRKAYSRKKALQIIKDEAGKQFDPRIVKLFTKIIKKINGKI